MNTVKKKELLTEKEYRDLPALNYSSIKRFVNDRKKFYKEEILGEPKNEDITMAIITGQLVDTLCFEGNFEEKFVLASVQPPTGQMLDFVNNLYKRTLKNTEGGEIMCSMQDLLEMAYNDTAFDSGGNPIAFKGKPLEKVISMFEGSDAELYYRQLRASTGKYVVTTNLIENAEAIVNELRSNPITAGVINAVTDGDIEVFNQYPIEFMYQGVEMKALLDKVIIDHKNKVISPYDLKTTWDNENFEYTYIKLCYYIQNAVYYKACQSLSLGYKVNPLAFIVCDSINYNQPLIYSTKPSDIDAALNGFSIRGKGYEGLDSLIQQIKWHKDSGVWNISYDDYANNGQKTLNLQYDK
jgi:hypothetical protein